MTPFVISRYHHFIARLQQLTQPYDFVQGVGAQRLSQWPASLMLALILVVLLVLIPRYVLSHAPSLLLRTGIALFSVLCLFAAYVMCRRGHYQAGGYLVIMLGSIVVLFSAISVQGEIGLRSLYYLIVLIVLGNLFFSPKVTLLAFNMIVTVTSLIFAHYRVDSARSQDSGGVGVGLTIARMIAQVHGGQIVLNSIPGEGSTFTLMLPYTPTTEAELV